MARERVTGVLKKVTPVGGGAVSSAPLKGEDHGIRARLGGALARVRWHARRPGDAPGARGARLAPRRVRLRRSLHAGRGGVVLGARVVLRGASLRRAARA